MAKTTKVRNRFQREAVMLNTGEESSVQQQFKDETDVNNVIDRYLHTRNPAILERTKPNYGFAEAVTYHEAMNVIVDTEAKFNSLPSNIRDHFNSDVMEFMEAMEKPDFEEVMKGLGTEFVENASSLPGGASSEQATEPSEGVSKASLESPAEQATTS